MTSPVPQSMCLATTSRVMCSHCDADVGTGVNQDGALCLNFCDEWYLACHQEYVDAYLDSSQDIPFCREDSLLCSMVYDTFDNSRQFCEFMGFRVISPSEQYGL